MSMNVLVTGASGGIGFATCQVLAAGGYTVYGLDVRQPEGPFSFRFLAADVTDGTQLEAAFQTIKEEAGSLKAILHVAGVYDLNSLVEITDQEFVRVFDINLFGVYRVNRLFLPLLEKQGRIIITTSELAPLDPLPFTGLYTATKTALESYAYSLRMEVQLLGYSVSVIRPGAVQTGLLGVSTNKLEAFCKTTQLYACNAVRFRAIVDKVEAKSIPPQKIGELALHILRSKRPRYVYNINRNPLLRLLNLLPHSWQTSIIRWILH
ncbi:SDR family NAD(P)-dependent oxidoreductase [Sphaerochaeta sp.]|uniref:SDR family oxidoreductase n=1 Tax=Sphaerochaeta sp. TaxID=1972642 RepID=UPI00258BAF1A|nr:SDR family NAD(P)-dependent oxidoreductase [Sphaerochaeta sp.]MDD3456250.1 SDR family NAD(P)-dependent oxidoreductase [Sphaerochaeta sp.]